MLRCERPPTCVLPTESFPTKISLLRYPHYICTYMYMFIYVCMYVYIYMYTHTCIHVYIYIYIHILPISLLRLSPLRLLDSNLQENPLWTCGSPVAYVSRMFYRVVQFNNISIQSYMYTICHTISCTIYVYNIYTMFMYIQSFQQPTCHMFT